MAAAATMPCPPVIAAASPSVNMLVCIYVRLHVCMCGCNGQGICVTVSVFAHARGFVHGARVYVCARAWPLVHARTCARTRMYYQTHVRTHTRMHVQAFRRGACNGRSTRCSCMTRTAATTSPLTTAAWRAGGRGLSATEPWHQWLDDQV